jgi:DNA-binding MarR family transcriptional regulator
MHEEIDQVQKDQAMTGQATLRARLSNQIGALALGLTDRLRSATANAADGSGETAAALVTIGAQPGMTVAMLAKAVGLSHPGAVRVADRLEAKGWISRGKGADKRNVTLSLTPQGQVQCDAALAARAALLDTILGPLEPSDALRFAGLMNGVLKRLAETQAPDSPAICRLCQRESCGEADCPGKI